MPSPTSPHRKQSFFVSLRPCLLPRVRPLQSCGGSTAIFECFSETDPVHVLRHGFDVARLEKDAVPFDEMRLACSQSMCVDLQNTGVHFNQCWREKMLQCKSEEVCVILIVAKERWHTYQSENLKKEKTFELDCFPTVLCAADRYLQSGHTGSREKSMACARRSLISLLTRTHQERFSHFSHTFSFISFINNHIW